MQVYTLVNLAMTTKENCLIQTNEFQDATIGKGVTITDAHSGENFCGNAGDTSGHSTYTNTATSASASTAGSSTTSSAGQTAMQKAKNTSTKPAPAPAPTKALPAKTTDGCAWGPGACGMQIILLLWAVIVWAAQPVWLL